METLGTWYKNVCELELMAYVDETQCSGRDDGGGAVSEINKNDIVRQINVHN